MHPVNSPSTEDERFAQEAMLKRHVVMISACVGALFGEGTRVRGIVPLDVMPQNSWARSGRAAIHGSHTPQNRTGPSRQLARQNPGAFGK